MRIGAGAGDAAARGALQVALLDEVGFDHIFQGAALFADAGGKGVEADRAAVEVVNDDGEQAAVEVVEAEAVDGEQRQGFVGNSAGDDAAAADLVDQEVLDKLNGHVGLDRPSPSNTVRAAQFPEGGRVVECKLAGPAETTYNPPGTDLPQGSIVCPVTTDDPAKPWLQPRVDQYGTESYVSWLVLRADETGAYTVIDIGRAFE